MEERRKLLADNAMTTLEDLMEFMGMDPKDIGIPDSVKNNLERLINAASGYIERMTDRRFGRKEYVEGHHGSGWQELCLNQYPIVDVKSIMDVESGQIIPSESYSFSDTGEIGVLYRDGGWADRTFLGGLANDRVAPKRYLKVTYTAGYILPKDGADHSASDLPFDLQYAVWQMVQQQWNLSHNGANGLSAFTISDVSWTFDKELNTQVQNVIEQYRRWA